MRLSWKKMLPWLGSRLSSSVQGAAIAGGLHEAGGGVDGARRADRDEQVGDHQRAVDPLHLVRHLAEPDDVRAQLAGGAARRTGGAVAEILLPADTLVAGEAPSGLELAVHVEDAASARALVKVVDILRDDQQLARPFSIKPSQRQVRRVRLHFLQPRPPRVVETLHERGIAREPFRSRHVLDAVVLPQPSEARKVAIRTRPKCRRR
jgi:hypothetical protein